MRSRTVSRTCLTGQCARSCTLVFRYTYSLFHFMHLLVVSFHTRQHTEPDLLDRAMRSLLYPGVEVHILLVSFHAIQVFLRQSFLHLLVVSFHARQHSEPDLLDRAMRSLLYPDVEAHILLVSFLDERHLLSLLYTHRICLTGQCARSSTVVLRYNSD